MIDRRIQKDIEFEINKILQSPAKNEMTKRWMLYRQFSGFRSRIGASVGGAVDPVLIVILDTWINRMKKECVFNNITLDSTEYNDVELYTH